MNIHFSIILLLVYLKQAVPHRLISWLHFNYVSKNRYPIQLNLSDVRLWAINFLYMWHISRDRHIVFLSCWLFCHNDQQIKLLNRTDNHFLWVFPWFILHVWVILDVSFLIYGVAFASHWLYLWCLASSFWIKKILNIHSDQHL